MPTSSSTLVIVVEWMVTMESMGDALVVEVIIDGKEVEVISGASFVVLVTAVAVVTKVIESMGGTLVIEFVIDGKEVEVISGEFFVVLVTVIPVVTRVGVFSEESSDASVTVTVITAGELMKKSLWSSQ